MSYVIHRPLVKSFFFQTAQTFSIHNFNEENVLNVHNYTDF